MADKRASSGIARWPEDERPRERLLASALIAAHNHPSGAAEPSEADKELTRDLIAARHHPLLAKR